MLGQPAGFIAEASSALASDAAAEPSQQRLANEAEKAINSVITNATQDIINNQIPITTTTAHAIIATKNILNNVATQSAQLMNTAMENMLPKSPSAPQTMAEQVASKSPPIGAMQIQTPNVVNQQVPMQQQPLQPQTQQVVPQQVQQPNSAVPRRADGNPNEQDKQNILSTRVWLCRMRAFVREHNLRARSLGIRGQNIKRRDVIVCCNPNSCKVKWRRLLVPITTISNELGRERGDVSPRALCFLWKPLHLSILVFCHSSIK